MTRWERLENELHSQRKTWTALASALGASKQSVGNWRLKGVPAKYRIQIDTYLGKPPGWTEGGDEFVELVREIDKQSSEKDAWPFELVDYESYANLPLPSRYAVQVRLRDAIIEEQKHLAKQEVPTAVPRAA
jgi:hypothetical protein